MYPYIDLGFIQYPTYGLLALVGIITAVAVMLFLGKKRKVSYYDLIPVTLAGLVGTIIGARLLYALTCLEDVSFLFRTKHLYTPLEFLSELNYITSGMVFYGGLYGGILFGFLWAKIKKADIKNLGDLFSVGIPAFHIFGRIGCFFAGCCYGVKSHIGFSGRVLFDDVREKATRFPTQLLEAFVLLIITAVLVFLFVKRIFAGRLLVVYLGLYAVARFFLEYLRGDEIRGRLLWFSTSQWISLLTLAGVVTYLFLRIQRRNQSKT